MKELVEFEDELAAFANAGSTAKMILAMLSTTDLSESEAVGLQRCSDRDAPSAR